MSPELKERLLQAARTDESDAIRAIAAAVLELDQFGPEHGPVDAIPNAVQQIIGRMHREAVTRETQPVGSGEAEKTTPATEEDEFKQLERELEELEKGS